MPHPEENFLHLRGMIHSIELSPAGTPAKPWPFCFIISNGVEEVTALVYRKDAEQMIEFFNKHLEKG